MTTPLTLGTVLLDMTVTLTADADFATTLHNDTGTWPDGATATLRFNDADATTWTATAVADVIAFNIDKTQVNALIAAVPRTALLYYSDGNSDLGWAQGRVVIHGA